MSRDKIVTDLTCFSCDIKWKDWAKDTSLLRVKQDIGAHGTSPSWKSIILKANVQKEQK